MDPLALDLRLPPDREAILAACDPCRDALLEAGLADHEVGPLCTLARELLQNAVKYGAYGPGDAVELTIRVRPLDVTIEVRNPVGGGPDQVRRVRQALRSMRGDDPLEVYVDRMRALADGVPHVSGGLGLARVGCQGHALLDFHVDGANKLTVSAVWVRGEK